MSSPTRQRLSVESLESKVLLAADLGVPPMMGVEPQAVAIAPPQAQAVPGGPVVCFDELFAGTMHPDGEISANTYVGFDQPGGPSSGIDPLPHDSGTAAADALDPSETEVGPLGPEVAHSATTMGNEIPPGSLVPHGTETPSSSTDVGNATPAGDNGPLSPLGPEDPNGASDIGTATPADDSLLTPLGPKVGSQATDYGELPGDVEPVDQVMSVYGSTDR